MAWPRLSESLTGPREPGICQACGAKDSEMHGGRAKVTAWIEHDELDNPESIAVWLCATCGDKLIQPHPRLYVKLAEYQPFPGCMELCCKCLWRSGTRCENPQQRVLGGPGLTVTLPKPMTAHIRCSPRSASGFYTFYSGPPTYCAGRLTRETVNEVEGGFDYVTYVRG